MKNIEIKTTQNVVLQYELADLRERIIAFLIDLAIWFFGYLMVIGVIASTFEGTLLSVMMILTSCISMFYSLGFETLNHGQTPGKMAMRIQVTKVTNGQPTFADYVARWVFRLVDIYFSLAGVASILIASSSKAQRIGDIVANTTVIRLASNMELSLKDILTIHADVSYKPVYHQAKQLAEEDVLLIKNTLDRYRKYHNDAHLDALNKLAARIAGILQVGDATNDKHKFLQIVLKDYVLLTR